MKNKYIILTTTLILALALLLYWKWSRVIPKTPVTLRAIPFAQLPGWGSSSLKTSLQTFQKSCHLFLKQNPDKSVGIAGLELKAKDWVPACRAALTTDTASEANIKSFFEKWFTPVTYYRKKLLKGLFTGYYVPLVKGSETPTDGFSVPIYDVPDDLLTLDLNLFIPTLHHRQLVARVAGKKILPYFTREQINKGAIKKHASVIAWINNPIDRVFLEIQGSAAIELENKQRIFINYAAENGAPYTSVAAVLIRQGVMTKHNASMQAIKHYLAKHPDKVDAVINQNKSFVFFEKSAIPQALGAQGIALTPGYSMAVDKRYIPMGVPVWLQTTQPNPQRLSKTLPMSRLMVAQDVGGAIHGRIRGDVFWGEGDQATKIAGHMKNPGYYWFFVPRAAAKRL